MILQAGMDNMLRLLEAIQAPPGITNHVAIWRGIQYPCSVSTEHRGEMVQLGGDMVEVQMTIVIRKSALDPMLDVSTLDITADSILVTADSDLIPPAPNHSIELTSRHREYRIAQVKLDGCESHYSLDLVDPYRP